MKRRLALAIVASLLAIVILGPSAAWALQVTSPSSGQVFYPGDLLAVSGKTSIPQQLVAISVYDPNERLIALDQVTSDNTGSFSLTLFRFPSEPRPNFPEGQYKIVVKEVASGETATITIMFTYITPTPTETPTETETAPPTLTVTVTETQTVTQKVTTTVTQTETQTQTQTVTQTQTYTQTVTETQTKTETKTVTVTTTPSPMTITKTSGGAVAGAAIVALIIGLLVGYAAFRGKK